MATEEFDIVVIGGGHNGLTCAAYLARGGLRVKVLERRSVVGGATLTEEFHPGFKNSVFSYLVSLLSPKVIADLDLPRFGLEILDRGSGSFSVLEGDHLFFPRDPSKLRKEMSRFSKVDAEAFEEFENRIAHVAVALREVAETPPPDFGGGLIDLIRLASLGNRARKLGSQGQADLAELMTMSVGHYLDRWFESDPIKGVLGFEGVIGNFVGPYHAGSAYVLLHHAFGQVNGRTGAWGLARGGMGSISQALAKSAMASGVEIETDAAVDEVITAKSGEATGVALVDGRVIKARAVAANVTPTLLFSQLVDPGLLPKDFKKRIDGWRSESATFRMNVALSEAPRFSSLSGSDTDLAYLNGTIDICPSLPYIENAYQDAKQLGWARRPVVSMCLPTTIDETLAPPGCHVMSLFCQHFRRELPDGSSWDDHRETVADHIIDEVTRYAPNFKSAVVGRQINSPLDIERNLNMTGGDIFHGALHLDQIFSLRPAAGHSDHRMPVKGLYLCGSGAHPGGGVTGLPGRNAALEILKDVR